MRFGPLVATLLAGAVLGCGGSGRCPLEGAVTYQGTPVDGVVSFFGADGGPAAGALVREGRYSIPASQGLEPGTYKVTVSWPGGKAKQTPEEIAAGASARAAEKLPAEYSDVSATKLTVDVLRGQTRYDFLMK